MKMKPGCGCFLILLAIVNLLLMISAIASMFSDLSQTGVAPSKLLIGATVLVFAANVGTSAMLGLMTFRGVSFGRKAASDEADESTPDAEEGTEEHED